MQSSILKGLSAMVRMEITRQKAYGKVLTMTMPSRSILNVMVERNWGWQGQGQNGFDEDGALNHESTFSGKGKA